ncbi:DNA gyrase subunit A [Microcystis panniformis FACHB-1757]|uniref:DNA gyrase subunit A n=1 Tax=Microcystis panniformis FACHB-1757 TaxID=1638788 RepID=A0A0K1S086_9CHRO|nr:DNA gyrase subunit A [Microcystis panniformis FACHB-1757]
MLGLGVSPDEKIFTPTDERGFLPYTPHPTPVTVEQEVAFPPPASKPDLRLSPYPAPE